MSNPSKLRHLEFRAVLARGRRCRLGRVAVQPAGNVVVEQLLAPQHARGRLPQHQRLVRAGAGRGQLGVELIRLGLALGHHLVEVLAERGRRLGRGLARPARQAGAGAGARRSAPAGTVTWYQNAHLVPLPTGLTVAAPWITWSLMPSLGYGVSASAPYSPARFVSFSQNSSCGPVPSGPGRGEQLQGPKERVVDGDRPVPGGPQRGPGLIGVTPGPGVAEPGGGQHMEGFGLGPGVGDLDGHQQVIRAGLGVVHLGDPVPVAVERARVQQLVLRLVAAAAGVDIDQVLIRERALRVVVAPPVPGVAGHRVQVPPVLLDVLAVVALRAGQPERPLLQDRVAADYHQMERVATELMRIFAVGLGMDKHFFDDKVDRHITNFSVLHYPDQPKEPLPGQLRAARTPIMAA